MRHRTLLIGAVLLVVVVVAVGIAAVFLLNAPGESAAGDVRPGPGGAGAVAIVMRDDSFEPATVTAGAGAATAFELRNDGQADHNFTNADLGVSTGPVKPGQVTTLTVDLPPGVTRFICTWHQGMTVSVEAS